MKKGREEKGEAGCNRRKDRRYGREEKKRGEVKGKKKKKGR